MSGVQKADYCETISERENTQDLTSKLDWLMQIK
jgi:hypothetical protein